MNIKLTDRIDFNAGYRYLSLKGSEYTVAGVTVETAARANIIYAGIGFRF